MPFIHVVQIGADGKKYPLSLRTSQIEAVGDSGDQAWIGKIDQDDPILVEERRSYITAAIDAAEMEYEEELAKRIERAKQSTVDVSNSALKGVRKAFDILAGRKYAWSAGQRRDYDAAILSIDQATSHTAPPKTPVEPHSPPVEAQPQKVEVGEWVHPVRDAELGASPRYRKTDTGQVVGIATGEGYVQVNFAGRLKTHMYFFPAGLSYCYTPTQCLSEEDDPA